MVEIQIDGSFPKLNEYINKERANKYGGASLKKKYTQMARLATSSLAPIHGKVDVYFEWHVTTRHDPDNIGFAKKFILDGLVEAQVIVNDNQKYIGKLTDVVIRDKKDYVKIKLTRNEE